MKKISQLDWAILLVFVLFLSFIAGTLAEDSKKQRKKTLNENANELREDIKINAIQWQSVDKEYKVALKELQRLEQLKTALNITNNKNREEIAYIQCEWQRLDGGQCSPPSTFSDSTNAATINDIIILSAKKNGIKPNDLLAISHIENKSQKADRQSTLRTNNINMILWCRKQKEFKKLPKSWDCQNESSVGLFQINLFIHRGVSYKQAISPHFSAEWTARRLKNHNYKNNRMYAILKHNGIKYKNGKINYGYAYAVSSISKKLNLTFS